MDTTEADDTTQRWPALYQHLLATVYTLKENITTEADIYWEKMVDFWPQTHARR